MLLFKKINSLRNCNPRIGYIKSIIEKLKRKQFINNTNNEFDMKPDLLCFTNGVYDLEIDAFRPGKKDDLISQVIPYDWHTSTDDETATLMKFIDKIMPLSDERDCLLTSLSSTLCGRLFEYILILTGSGRNGKDTLITGLLKESLGQDIYYNNSVKLLTNPSNGICQEKANMNKKRAVVYGEPGKKETLKCDILKEIRGCPQLNARALYSKNTIVHNISTNIIHCNSVPELDSVDDAIKNSLAIFTFRALFRTEDVIAELPKDTEYLYLVDSYYKSNEFLNTNKLVFMNILIKYFKILQNNKFVMKNVPESVKSRTKEYMEDSDDFMNWFQEQYEKTNDENDFIKIGTDLYLKYKQSDLYSNLTKPQKRKANKKHMFRDIEENPNLRMYYKKEIRLSIDNKQTRFTHVLINHKKREDETDNDIQQFLPTSAEPYDSDDN